LTTQPTVDNEGRETSVCSRDNSHIRYRAVDRLTVEKLSVEGEPVVVPPAAPPVAFPPPEESLTMTGTPDVSVLEQLENAGVPLITVGNSKTPLFAGSGYNVWALLNLILCIAGAAIAVFTVLRFMKNRSDERNEEDFVYRDEEDGNEKRRRPGWLVASFILGIAGVLVFIFTQDMNNLMVLIDTWTIVNVAILIIEIIAARVTFKEKEDTEKASI
jgi:RsiW-degrading membrane proteinase PrsW (M82 family)